MIRARFRGPPPRLEMVPPAEEDAARELRLRTVLLELGVPTRARCVGCGHPQPFTGITGYGLCVACSLMREGEPARPQDPTLERLTSDTEPVLSSDRDTRPTDHCGPPDDWAAP